MEPKQAILVIDDEEAVREAVSDILDLESLAVLKASDGEAGIELYAQQQDEIALVILDLTMPGLSGKETLRRLKEIDPGVQVLLSSGYTKEEVAGLVADVSGAGFLQKPYTALQLIETVNQLLDRPGSIE